MTMAVDEHDKLPEATQRESELQRQLDGLQSQVTELHMAREEVVENLELSSEVQSLKKKLDEHSKQLEQSATKLNQLESENLTLRDENQALNTESTRSVAFGLKSDPCQLWRRLTPEKAKGTQTYDVEDSESDPELDKEVSKGGTTTKSHMTAYLEQMFSKRLDAMKSMVGRLPGVAPPIWKSDPDFYADTPFTDENTLIEMPRKFSFPSIKVYDGTVGKKILRYGIPPDPRQDTGLWIPAGRDPGSQDPR
ncbi:hypothetical protein F2Q68_00004461 [Brassica cretica]|uniref:Uncharacterized protein n=1 Tax=Brassica cretica TaxID=69181 RepID=A0A8S9J437_BRACR|nr:hypothetical protein F2Q68_00004461 [Brassica cretica]